MGLLWDSSHWTPSGFSLYCTSVCLGGWILLFNPLISRGMIWCWPGRLAKPGVEGQITATDVLSNHICFIAEKERVHSHTGLDSLVTLWIYLFIYLFWQNRVLKLCKLFVYRDLSPLYIWWWRSKPCHCWKWLSRRQKTKLHRDRCQCQEGNPPELQ